MVEPRPAVEGSNCIPVTPVPEYVPPAGLAPTKLTTPPPSHTSTNGCCVTVGKGLITKSTPLSAPIVTGAEETTRIL